MVARLRTHRTACPDIELVGAVLHPSSGAIESRLHAYFGDARVNGSEWFVDTPDLREWVEHFAGSPGVATSVHAIQETFNYPSLWPWVPHVQPEVEGQLTMPVVGGYSAPVGRGTGQTSSVSEDWYTPTVYVEAAREVLGAISLWTRRRIEINQTVRAENIYTADVDGLRQRWFGRVFLNPPWGAVGRPKKAFVRQAVRAYEGGEIEAAILVLNANATTTAWFEPLFRYPICFPNHRVAHYGPGGVGGSPNTGTVFIYLGHDDEGFARVFSRFGAVVHPLRLAAASAAQLAEDYVEETV